MGVVGVSPADAGVFRRSVTFLSRGNTLIPRMREWGRDDLWEQGVSHHPCYDIDQWSQQMPRDI